VPLAFAQQHAVPDLKAKPGTAAPNRFYVWRGGAPGAAGGVAGNGTHRPESGGVLTRFDLG
jgi:hypothetical protein